jgi:two-component system, OmpR family, response regulator
MKTPCPSDEALIPPDARAGLHILIVEDDRDNARSLSLLLQTAGHLVEVAADGPAALRSACACPPDVVLLDIGLPGMDGYEVARRLVRRWGEQRPFLVAVTGYGHAAARRRSAAAGIDMHLVKPADPDGLLRLLREFQRVLWG